MKTDSPDVVDLAEKFGSIDDLWSPRIVASLNDYHLKLARIKGEFVWHDHPDTDEAFLVLEGAMHIDFADRSVALHKGQLYVVPAGVSHRPRAETECRILLITPAGVVNTGASESALTSDPHQWA